MIKTIIIDDEQPARDYLEKIVNRYFPNKFLILQKCSDVEEGINAINFYNPDLVFLDIRMKNQSGFDVFKKLDKVEFEVIFTTAYSEYALEAIKQSALDYLLKPINHIELGQAIKKFERKNQYKHELDRIRLLLDNINISNVEYPKIAFPSEYGYKLVKSDRILYCKADINYTVIKLIDNSMLIVSKTLKKVEELLPPTLFLRIHKSYLVNINSIKEYSNKEGCFVILTNQEMLPISTRKKTEIIEKLSLK